MSALLHKVFAVVAGAMWCLQPAQAHEFWIEPVAPRVATNDQIEARTFIGNAFVGEEIGNFPSMQVKFDIVFQDSVRNLAAQDGQLPAVRTQVLGEGLHILRYQSRDFQLTYETYDHFLAFLSEAQRLDLAEEHDKRGLARDDIREVYFRYAKSLVAAGHGEGADRFLGMPWELVALTNPYVADFRGPMMFELRFNGELAVDAAAHVFIRSQDGAVEKLYLRSDSSGVVSVPSDVSGTYMVNAIKIMPASARMEYLLGASWQSLWASMTYEVE